MRTVIARVLARTELATVGRAERSVRKGVTIVPRRGVRVVQSAGPRRASALEAPGAERRVAGEDALAEVP